MKSSLVILSVILLSACHSGGKWKSFSGDEVIERKVDSVLKLMTLEEKSGK